MAQLDSAARPAASKLNGCTTSSPLPTCTILSLVGNSARAASRRPAPTSARTRCFIDTDSPARSSMRSSTLCTRSGAAAPLLPPPPSMEVGTLKRQGSMPFCQELKTKAWSRCAPAAPAAAAASAGKGADAVTK